MSGFHPKDLIAEIKCRPGIYNKAILEHPRRDKKHLLWLEVGEKLTPPEDWKSYTNVEKDARIDEIQAKWKHLKDHFYREIKVLHEGSTKKRKYVYFDDMEFMRPFVGLKLQTVEKNQNNDSLDDSTSFTEKTTQDDLAKMNDSDFVMEEFLKSTDSNHADDVKLAPAQLRTSSRRQLKPPPKAMERKTLPSNAKIAKEQKVVAKNVNGIRKNNAHPASSTTRGNSSTSPGGLPSFKIRDGDIAFCLSLVPTFRKFSDSSKLRAKIEVLRILHKYVEQVERLKGPTIEVSRNKDNSEDPDIQEEDSDINEVVSVKHEQTDDPLTNSSGNTKAWWT